MRKYSSELVLLCLCLLYTINAATLGYIYGGGKDYGDYSPRFTAQPELGNIHSDYYVCGMDLLESRWIVSLWNCHCGNRWYRWRRSWRCNWCDNQFWSQVSAVRLKLCHKDNWDIQKTQVFSTGKTQTRNWRGQVSCPKNQYATGIAVRVGSEHNVDLGMVGFQFTCQDIKLTQKSTVQDSYGHPLTEMSKNPAGSFITALEFRHLKNDKLTGVKAYFAQDLRPQSVTIEYGKVELIGEKESITIETFEQENKQYEAIPFDISFKKTYTVGQKWTLDIEAMNNLKLRQGTVIMPPVIGDTKVIENPYFKPTSTPFQFNVCQTTTYASVKTVPTSISWCYVQKGIAVVDQQKARAPFTMTLKFVSPTTNQVIIRTVTGFWQGQVYYPIRTDEPNIQIPGCKSD